MARLPLNDRKCGAVRHYFTDIGKNLAANIRKPTLPVSVPRRTMNSIGLIESTTQEVKSVIRNLKS
ncbi:hypothetical protein HHI36_005090, partial [Cryptolaemus montrouzieri]